MCLILSAKGFETEFRERINRPNPTNKKRLFKSPSPKGKVVPPAGTNNEPKQGAFNQKMNKPSKGRDNRKQAQSSKPSRQTMRSTVSKQSKPDAHQPQPEPPTNLHRKHHRKRSAAALRADDGRSVPQCFGAKLQGQIAGLKSLSQMPRWAMAYYKHVVIKVHAPKNTPLDCTKRWSEFGRRIGHFEVEQQPTRNTGD